MYGFPLTIYFLSGWLSTNYPDVNFYSHENGHLWHLLLNLDELATTGPYARIRHPQYVGFFLIMLGFLIQWPTILTLLMFPILTYMYYQLAKNEEREVRKEFGERYTDYAARVPAIIPKRKATLNVYHEPK